ncbi:MAG: BMP family ABC transporter substrate-binding protein [Spirochaetaceae bacterium]|jgi:simple sugar transport system substrate-binding protein|nr:BMP family ABC transporter substrate-binding protein [Spirochaetaceae bacterium]
MKIKFLLVLAAFATTLGCASKKNGAVSIAVFIPGQMAGSTIYAQLGAGAERAVAEWNNGHKGGTPAHIVIVEAGYNQAEWESKLTILAAGGQYNLIVSSNPSMPYFVSAISEKFPAQQFLLLDAELAGNPNVYTLRYNQHEQAYMAGYLAGLLSEGAPRIGLIAAQEYPVMDNVIKPGYLEGANAAAAEFGFAPFVLDYRIVGNWFDAQKAAELGASMVASGIKAILPISGSANEGAVQAAAEGGAKILWFDSNGYAIRPGVIAGSCALLQEQAVYDKLMLYFEGNLPFGTADVAGLRDGYLRFVDDDPLYIQTVPQAIRDKQASLTSKIKSGALTLD